MFTSCRRSERRVYTVPRKTDTNIQCDMEFWCSKVCEAHSVYDENQHPLLYYYSPIPLSSTRSLTLRFTHQNPVWPFLLLHTCHSPYPSHSPWFDRPCNSCNGILPWNKYFWNWLSLFFSLFPGTTYNTKGRCVLWTTLLRSHYSCLFYRNGFYA
jgi:hypothetical protein